MERQALLKGENRSPPMERSAEALQYRRRDQRAKETVQFVPLQRIGQEST